MRIAYIANYQGASLVKNRPCQHNLSLAARVKIQLVAELLQRSGHEVEIISQGSTQRHTVGGQTLTGADRFRSMYFPGLLESEQFHPSIPIYYASALAVRFLTGFWESLQAQRLLKARHIFRRYDAVIIYNLQRAQIGCAHYAGRRLGLPVILQYEDDTFVNVHGQASDGLIAKYHRKTCRKVLRSISGGTGVSPYLLSQMPSHIPKLLLRGIVSEEILGASKTGKAGKRNWVVFSGTHEGTQGLEQLVKAWRSLGIPNWELHVAGQGPLTATLEKLAQGDRSIVFHGLLNRVENASLLCAAKLGLNPQDLTKTPGNVFPFKVVEYLAAGTHVISTPRGYLEPELEAGVTYIRDNEPETIAGCLKQLIQERRFEVTAEQAAVEVYGPAAVSRSLNQLLAQVTAGRAEALATPSPDEVAAAEVR